MADSTDTDVVALARLLNLTTRHVQRLATEGVLPKPARGKYPLLPAAHAYIRYLQDKLSGSGDAAGLSSERAALARAQREHTDLRVSKLRGELVPAGAAIRVMQALAVAMKSRLTGMPFVLKQRFPEISGEVVSELQELIEDALRQVSSDGLPAEYRVFVPGSDADPGADAEGQP